MNQHPVNQHAGGLHPSDTAFLYWPVTKLLRLNAISRQLQLRGCALQFVDEPQDNLTCVSVCVFQCVNLRLTNGVQSEPPTTVNGQR